MYYAHSGSDSQHRDWQLLSDHLRQVAQLAAARVAAATSTADARFAEIAGLLHDLGKYRPEFQLMIKGGSPPRERTYHKHAGAAKAGVDLKSVPVAFAIAGHHGGLPDLTELQGMIKSANGLSVAQEVWPDAVRDFNELTALASDETLPLARREGELLTRLIFSALVDADWNDTSNHERSTRGLPPEPSPSDFEGEKWLNHLIAFLQEKSKACTQNVVRECRQQVLEACLDAALLPTGIFSLTVPTGGGKTLASMAFALKHATSQTRMLRRIIYVAPYLTILEQNEDAILTALSIPKSSNQLFVHHSLAEPPTTGDNESTELDAIARRAENWDAPLIVTTNTQFFESLFSNKPSRCRKLHNIARSVVILDECQTLPPGLIAPTCGLLRQICDQWGTTILLCTATQPALGHDSIPEADRLVPTEIIPKSTRLFDRLQRVNLHWPSSPKEALSWSELTLEMRRCPAALCIVNSRRAAREVFESLAKDSLDGVFHLSTSMCPAHRKRVLREVRGKLTHRRPCYLVSTQLIEAGVDVDFPTVFRELSPLESIIQAAGRCNREGKLADENGNQILGRVVVFRSQRGIEEPQKYFPPDAWYKAGRSTLENHFLNAGKLPQINQPADIDQYFTRLFHSGSLDQHKIQDDRRGLKFKTVAENYSIIADSGIAAVVATWSSKRDRVERLLKKVRRDPSRANFRALAPYQVNLRYYELRTVGQSVVPISEKIEHPVWYGRYDDNLGISSEATDALLIA
ncbi:MAG: CRISPR-associated endonuclease Cas3'' [Pirellulaceae bacterium]|nr:CRISPR-associated endonuclease Cas3'' [Pirellulaceae bacterium]